MNQKTEKKKWYVFYTYPKFERKVHESLKKENLESFLPLHWVVKQWSDRKKKLQTPLFPSYIFVNIERTRIFEVLKSPKVIHCVSFNGKPSFLQQKEVDFIKRIVESNYQIDIGTTFKIGDNVQITEGAFSGMKGIILEERGNQRFAMKIESIQQSIFVNIPSNKLEYVLNPA